MAPALAEGSAAPDFAMDSTDGPVSLTRYAGRFLVLYFYPKDDTPACTQEAIDFSAQLDAFAAAGADVLGVSRDPLAKHTRFTQKQGLKVALASDSTGAACEAYGTWEEKSMYGRTYMGIARRTFLIGPDGEIRRVWPKVKVKGHVEDVLAALAE